MPDLKVNSQHDIDFNDFVLTTDNAQSVAQRIKIRLLRFNGEWFRNQALGIDYFGSVFGRKSKDVVDTIFIDEIINTTGVQSIDAYESSIEQNTYIASFVATTTEGVTFQFNIQPIALA